VTEGQFFKRTVGGGAGLTVAALIADRAVAHNPPPVAPFGEPWLTLLGGIALWLAIITVSHVARWVYLIIRGQEPSLGGDNRATGGLAHETRAVEQRDAADGASRRYP